MGRGTCNLVDFVVTVGSAGGTTTIPVLSKRRRIHRVLPQLKLKNKHRYEPVIVSLGPYHHGRSDLQAVEEYKHTVLEMFISASGNHREFFYSALLRIVREIRDCYVGVSMEDGALSEMMLLDACFVINVMEMFSSNKLEVYGHWLYNLGAAALRFISQDMNLLENQIPLFVIKFLISLRYGNEGHRLIIDYLRGIALEDETMTFIPGEDEDQPLHLLEARHRIFMAHNIPIQYEKAHDQLPKREESRIIRFSNISGPFRSVTYLKERGIYCRPSSYSFNDIRFSSYPCWGVLHLPIRYMGHYSAIFYSNMIAYETSPESRDVTGLQVTSYVNFMKSLIEKTEDVKELREKNIIFSSLGSDEEIVKVFKELDTLGLDNHQVFKDVKYRLGQHCSSKAKTWIAELGHTYFRSPLSAMALLAATFLLILTFLQTYYTMNPVSLRAS